MPYRSETVATGTPSRYASATTIRFVAFALSAPSKASTSASRSTPSIAGMAASSRSVA